MIQIRKMTREDRCQHAREHVLRMRTEFADEIEQSTNYSQIYDFRENPVISTIRGRKIHPMFDTKIDVVDTDTVSALFDLHEETGGDRIAVLNFASYKNPGGMFYEGSSAQEEFLCHHSTLYPILTNFQASYYDENKKMLNRALYTDRALYSMYVNFFDFNNRDISRYTRMIEADVITCAAPNVGTFRKYYDNNLSCDRYSEMILEVLKRRCSTVLLTAVSNNTKSIILGAFGCGVFKNNPIDVAIIFRDLLETEYSGFFKNVIFAIPSDKTGNHDAFKKIFN